MGIQRIIVSFEDFEPVYGGNGFVFNNAVDRLLGQSLANGTNEGEDFPVGGFFPDSLLLPGFTVLRETQADTTSGQDNVEFNGLEFPCHSRIRQGVFSAGVARVPINPDTPDFDALGAGTPQELAAILSDDNNGAGNPENWSIIQFGPNNWTALLANPVFPVPFENISLVSTGSTEYQLYPGFTESTSDSFAFTSTYTGITITDCEGYDPRFPRFTRNFQSSGSNSFGDRILPIVANTEGSSILCSRELGTALNSGNHAVISRAEMDSLLLLEVTAESSNPLMQYFSAAKQEVGKPRFLSFVGDSVYVAIEEYQQLLDGRAIDRPYFRSDFSILLNVLGDQQPRQEPVTSLQIPEGLVYGVDFRIDDIGFFK